MNLAGRTLWQVGAGDTERNYGEICTRFDVMLIGPGAPREYSESAYAHLGGIRHSLRRFYLEAKCGDIVLLRIGTANILAVGIVADDAGAWLDAFGDVDGWDLNHVRRVRWLPNFTNKFDPTTLGSRVSTFAKVKVASVRKWVEDIPEPDSASGTRDLAALPASGTRLTPQTLGTRLFNEGLPSEYIEKLTTTLASIERVAPWYKNETKRPEGRPSEHETVCYLVMPLLLSLGWSQQTAAIEWNHVDVALFNGTPSTDSNLTCVVEAKLLGRSVFTPVGQAKGYALQNGREACTRLVVTDGIRYALHRRTQTDFQLEAYLNILDMREAYPLHGCKGAVEAILGMAR